MNRPEAEQLLGGYATGTLTESEKAVLFSAALEHQELFDALVDEEALRALLADPEARARLLGLLPPAERSPRTVRQLWRRPAVLGLAASLFVLVTTSYMVLRRPESALLERKRVQQDETVAGNLGATAGASKQNQTESLPPNPVVQEKAPLTIAKSPAPTKTQRRAEPPTEVGAALAGKGPEKEAKTELALADPPGMVAEAMAPSPKMARTAKPEELPQAADRAMADANGPLASGAPVEGEASKRMEAPDPVGNRHALQVFPMVQLPEGRARLKVEWGPDGHLYLLKRSPSGVVVLPALKTALSKTGLRMATFEFPLGAKDVLDVYVLSGPVPDPTALLPSANVPGTWRRVKPEAEDPPGAADTP